MCVLRDEADPLQERELMAHPISSPEIAGCLERHPIKHSKAFTKKNYGSKFQSPRYPKISKDLGCFGMDRAKLSPKMACACVTMIWDNQPMISPPLVATNDCYHALSPLITQPISALWFWVTHEKILPFLPAPGVFSPRQDEMLASHVVCSHIRSHPDANPEEKTKKPKTNKTSHLNPISHWEENMFNQLDGKKRRSLSLLLKMEPPPKKKTTRNLLVFGGLSKTNHENWKISLGNVIALLLSSIESFHVFFGGGTLGLSPALEELFIVSLDCSNPELIWKINENNTMLLQACGKLSLFHLLRITVLDCTMWIHVACTTAGQDPGDFSVFASCFQVISLKLLMFLRAKICLEKDMNNYNMNHMDVLFPLVDWLCSRAVSHIISRSLKVNNNQYIVY